MPVPATSRFQRYLSVISRWLLILGLVFAATMLAGQFVTDYLLPQTYTTTAKVEVRPQGVVDTDSITLARHPTVYSSSAFKAEIAIMRSRDLLLPIIHDLGLESEWARRVFKLKEVRLSDIDALAYMNQILRFDLRPGTNIIAITVSSEVPLESAAIANAFVDKYKVMRDEEEDRQDNRLVLAFKDKIANQQKIVDEKKVVLENMPKDQSPTFLNFQRESEQQQHVLIVLQNRLKENLADYLLTPSPVRIVSRAEVPTKADHATARRVTIIVASLLSLLAASFVEMILLFKRASERHDN
jgi:uncharacterized protein involved in exopolysaccharide biosynthesis